MGHQATVVVLLDRLDEIEKDPEFGKKLGAAIRYKSCYKNIKPNEPGFRFGGDEATGQTQVIEVHHADEQWIVALGGNTGQVIGYGGSWRAKPWEMIKELYREMKKKFQDGLCTCSPHHTREEREKNWCEPCQLPIKKS